MRLHRLHRRLTLALQCILLVGLSLAIWRGQWLNAVASVGVIGVTLLPQLLGLRFRVFIPPEFQLLAIVFVYAAIILGEVHGYYTRFWWWDVALHTASGFLLGLVALLLVYVLNEKRDIQLSMQPGFVALFAFMFAVGMGALWEIFEYFMDSVFGLNMQKSGLRDTMWDLIVDALGALCVSLLGYSYLHTVGTGSFVERWIQNFIRSNPRLFRDDEGRS